MDELVSRQAMLNMANGWTYNFCDPEDEWAAMKEIRELPSAEPEDWMERNKERILQAGMEGREIEFRIGGRLFAIREKAK